MCLLQLFLVRHRKAKRRKALDKWMPEADRVDLWESNKLTVSQRGILITQWVGEAAKKIDVEMGVEYRRRLFEKDWPGDNRRLKR